METENTKKRGTIGVTIWRDTAGGRKYGVSCAINLREAKENLVTTKEEARQAELAERFMLHSSAPLVTDDRDCRTDLVVALTEYDEWDRREANKWRLTEARLGCHAAEILWDLIAGKISDEEAIADPHISVTRY